MMSDWTFFSNYGHVLVCLGRDQESRLRDVADQVGITERAVQNIVKDLQQAGYLEISKHGRRNRYRINNRKALRHPIQSGCTVGQLLGLFDKSEPSSASKDRDTNSEAGRPTEPAPKSKPTPTADRSGSKGDSGGQGQLF